MKWIVIEGPDNVGKSTFINDNLAKYIHGKNFSNIEFQHFSGPKTKDPYQEMRQIANHYTAKLRALPQDSVVINDRSIFGELVYAPLYREYYPDYLSLLVETLCIAKIEVLFIVIYADKNTYDKFNISNKTETDKHESNNQSEIISNTFIDEIHNLKFGKVVVINSNNYVSLDKRNSFILKHIDAFLSNTKYSFGINDPAYSNIPFNDKDRFHMGIYGFAEPLHIDLQDCFMYKNLDCELGLEHSKFSKYGIANDKPTAGFGTITNVKYVFVGEAPGQKGCGTYGIPFYGDVSGNLFMSALYENNISLFNCYITNAIKCCPDGNDLKSYYGKNALDLECVKKLKSELEYILDINHLNTVYAVGATAQYILSKILDSKYTIKKIYHPAYYVRMGKSYAYPQYLRDELNSETK